MALEVGLGAACGGARALATMKHVGLNAAADVLFTAADVGVTGLVIVSAADPGMASSQYEQDNRHGFTTARQVRPTTGRPRDTASAGSRSPSRSVRGTGRPPRGDSRRGVALAGGQHLGDLLACLSIDSVTKLTRARFCDSETYP